MLSILVFLVDDIGSNIESSQAATSQGKTQLAKAAKTQRSNSSLVICDAPFYIIFFWDKGQVGPLNLLVLR